MRLKGKVRIEFRHKDTGEETKPPVEQENLIFDATFLSILGAVPAIIFGIAGSTTTAIVISATTTPPAANTPVIDNILATGSVPGGVTSPIWYENVTPTFGEIQNQISAPTVSPRTFHTVGLTRGATRLAATLLTIPCTQGLFEVLTIFYVGTGSASKAVFNSADAGKTWAGTYSWIEI